MNEKTARLLATWFYIGELPFAPGSVATFAGMLMALILMPLPLVYVAVTLAVSVIGFKAADMAEKQYGKKDPGNIVIDEVAGIMISFFLLPARVDVLFVTFFLFRAFDMFKIYPVNKFEKYEGGTGIMMDDIIAGIYTNVIMQMAIRMAA